MSSNAPSSQSAHPPTSAPGPATARAEEPVGGASSPSQGAREAVEVSVPTQSAVLVEPDAAAGTSTAGTSTAGTSTAGTSTAGASAAGATKPRASTKVVEAVVEAVAEKSAAGATHVGMQEGGADASGAGAPRGSRRSGASASTARQKNNVRKIRIERMMSKAELARRANLSVLTIDRIEKGFGCRMDTKRKILEALGLSLDDRVRVFGEEE